MSQEPASEAAEDKHQEGGGGGSFAHASRDNKRVELAAAAWHGSCKCKFWW